MTTTRPHDRHDASLRWAMRIGAVTLLISLALTIIAMQRADNGALHFARIGTRFSEQDPDGTTGYDGQFAYYIARDGADAMPLLDGASLRFQRILYPILARILSFGQDALVLSILVAINIMAHAAGAGMITYLLVIFGASPFGGMIYSLWLGTLTALLLDLHEPLTFALALAAVITYQHQCFRATIALLMLATLAKELALIFAAGLALHAALHDRRHWAVLIFGGPMLMFLTWWGVMRVWFGTLPTRYPAARFQLIPFRGLTFEDSGLELFFLIIWLVLPTIIFLGAGASYYYRHRTLPLTLALLLPAAGFMMMMPGVAWDDPVAAYRVGLPIIITGILFIGQCYPAKWKWLAGLWTPGLLFIVLGRDIFL